MRLLATLATAGLVVWGANQAAQHVDPELWRAPAAAVREGLAQALEEPRPAPAKPQREPDPEPDASATPEVSHPQPPARAPFVVEHVPAARGLKTAVEPAPLTREEAERIRYRLERVMQLARVGDR